MAEITSQLKVLISSKQREFAAERGDIRKMMKPLPLLVADAAEDWSPQEAPVKDVFLRAARGCGIYVGLFGCIYSYPTILEYEAAAENRYRPLLLYIRECPNRDAALEAFISRIGDPDSGHTIVVYSDWNTVRQQFKKHLWAAVGRIVDYALQLGNPPRALGERGPMERRWAERKQAFLELGLPANESEARELAELFTTNLGNESSNLE